MNFFFHYPAKLEQRRIGEHKTDISFFSPGFWSDGETWMFSALKRSTYPYHSWVKVTINIIPCTLFPVGLWHWTEVSFLSLCAFYRLSWQSLHSLHSIIPWGTLRTCRSSRAHAPSGTLVTKMSLCSFFSLWTRGSWNARRPGYSIRSRNTRYTMNILRKKKYAVQQTEPVTKHQSESAVPKKRWRHALYSG